MAAPTPADPGFVDYYERLEISPGADIDTIRDRLDALILEWQQFTGSNKRALRREAEDMLDLVARAEKTLLDPGRRAAYDTRHAQDAGKDTTGGTGAEPEASSPGAESLARAEGAYLNDDYKAARFFANRATEQNPDLGQGWFLLFAACLHLDDPEGAEIAGTTAVRLDPTNPLWSSHVGGFLTEALGETERGLALMENAAQHDTTPQAGCLLAEQQREAGKRSKALSTMRDLHERFPDDPDVRDELARALVSASDGIPRVRSQSMYLITGDHEIERMRTLINEARDLRPRDRELKEHIGRVVALLAQAEEPVFTFRLFESSGISTFTWWSAPGGVLLGLLLLSFGNPLGLVFLILGGLAIALVAMNCRPPQWELNARTEQEEAYELRMAERLGARGF
ncbi:J domain-containing protein [Nocardiopsis valliformis]|uniref:J domain-containing protein n=1 Tax=Nocardiopsis valliformis TaxID=239974 RepID=UPI000347CEF8|nr:hypothetical protein [Nocardiopsis valliformis]